MRRRYPETELHRLPKSVRIYLDDVKEIFRTLDSLGPDWTVEAGTRELVDQLRSVDDVIAAGKALNAEALDSLYFSAVQANDGQVGASEGGYSQPKITVNLGRDEYGISNDATVQISPSGNLTLKGARNAILELLRKRESFFGAWGRESGYPLAIAFSMSFWVWGLLASQMNAWIFALVVFLVIGFLLLAGKTLFGSNPRPTVAIVLKYKAEAPGFFERSKDNIAVAAFFFLLGVAVSWLLFR